ncbi:MAG: polysaccharide biosynthesis protein [Sphaerochaeta sp.]|jgi:UDP-glucose 4-epimerase|nr:polysaccharide biosynthesis protein [Sphaerochaeta sp.]
MMDLKGARIFISGGTGSFGTALIDYLHDSGARFIVYSRDEMKQHEMRISRQDKNISYIIGDIRDRDRLIQSMHGVDYVFSAAALKHVPTGENFPGEAVQTNFHGTENIVYAADVCGVRRLVFLSSDKAAEPRTAYGMTKGLAERIITNHSGFTICTSLRYGNVLGSRGSVVPLFLKQIAEEKPVTITDPNMTRFILTLEEAVKLALKCLCDGDDGDLFVMKPPACSIRTLVDALKLHFGDKVTETVIGIRPMEKPHEVLLTGEEMHRGIVEKEGSITYVRLKAQRGVDYHFRGNNYVEPAPFTSENAEQLGAGQVLSKLREAGLL